MGYIFLGWNYIFMYLTHITVQLSRYVSFQKTKISWQIVGTIVRNALLQEQIYAAPIIPKAYIF